MSLNRPSRSEMPFRVHPAASDHVGVRCAICQRDDRPLTREHVFARWLTQRLGSAGDSRVIATVCADCNAGWMSGVEVSFRRLLTGTRNGPIAAPDRVALARWFTKTAVLLADAGGVPLVPAERNHALVAGMLDDVSVYLARRRRRQPHLGFALDDGVRLLVHDLAAHVTAGEGEYGTRIWPPRTRALRWDTLPVVS